MAVERGLQGSGLEPEGMERRKGWYSMNRLRQIRRNMFLSSNFCIYFNGKINSASDFNENLVKK
ncbi:MAG: hypothetical protein ACFFG0_08570 [Candidatus Thorarchaeota archaeon]